jgi:hypothetical protein
MTICPIAIVAGCQKCPAFKICPLKGVLGDKPPAPVAAAKPIVAAKPKTAAKSRTAAKPRSAAEKRKK